MFFLYNSSFIAFGIILGILPEHSGCCTINDFFSYVCNMVVGTTIIIGVPTSFNH